MEGIYAFLNSNSLPIKLGDNIPEKDFNNITKSGWYYYSSAPFALKLINCPSSSTGSFLVISLDYLQIQLWADVNNGLYFRDRYPSYNWNNWIQIK